MDKQKFLRSLGLPANLSLLAVLVLLTICGCAPVPAQAAPTPQPLPDVLVLYDWVDDIPQQVLDAFAQEFGVYVRYETYQSQEEAIEQINQGRLFDVVIMNNDKIPALIQAGRLAELDHANLSNLNNIAADFRDSAFDPGNRYSVPFNWGTTGLVARSDLVAAPVTSWSDLWKQGGAGKVVLWNGLPREMLGAALKSLRYSANSENRAELEAALHQLEILRPNLIFAEDYGPELETSSPLLTLGEAVLAVGWSYDAVEGQKEMDSITYILPKEGALLWGDNFVIPANSPNQYAAEVFVNFMLRPEISALITNEKSYATGNTQAEKFILPDILENPLIFPPIEDVRRAEYILPLSPQGEALHAEIWAQFLGETQ